MQRTHSVKVTMVNAEQIRGAKQAVTELIKSKNANPILVRLAWHDSGSYDKSVSEWPQCGGANASIRFSPELAHGANAGLVGAVALLEPIKEKYPEVSYADLFQLASAVAVEIAGGPTIPLRFGRVDAPEPVVEGRLPGAAPPFADKAKTPGEHLKNVFYRMGLNDQEIVALSGAHTLGRARPDRSGFGKESTKYTGDGKGQSWTVEWLKFDNSYFVEVKAKRDEDLLVLPTDAALFEDEGFKPFAEKYAVDQQAFFDDYASAHVKLSELGSKWEGGVPVAV